MKKVRRNIVVRTLAIALAAGVTMPGVHAQDSTDRRRFDITSQQAVSALNTFAEQADITLVFSQDDVSSVSIQPLVGTFSIDDGIERLLDGTGLVWQEVGDRSIVISRAGNVFDSGSNAVEINTITVKGKGISARQRLRDTPNSFTVISSERIEEQNLSTLNEVMTQTPGISITGSNPDNVSFIARGFTINNFLIDGAPLLAFPGVMPDTAIYERIDILRGPNALFTGAGNPAGSINLVRKRPNCSFGVSGSIGVGSWSNYRGTADLNGTFDDAGRACFRVVAAYQDQDFFYDVAHQTRGTFYGVGEFSLTPGTTVTLGGQYQESEIPLFTGLPGYAGLPDGGLIDFPRSTYIGADWARNKAESYLGFVELSQDLPADWHLNLVAQVAEAKGNRRFAFVGANALTPENSQLPFGAMGGRSLNRDLGTDLNFSGPLHLFGREHSLLFGADFQRSRQPIGENRLYPTGVDVVDIHDPDPDVNVPDFTALSSAVTRTEQYGIYSQLQLDVFDDLRLITGARATWWKSRAMTRTRASEDAPWADGAWVYNEADAVTAYAGFVYDLAPQIAPYLSIAETFTPQSQRRSNGDVLPPANGRQFEGGLKSELFDRRLLLSLGIYRIRQTGLAVRDPAIPDGAGGFFVPAGKIESKGVEIEAVGRITDSWSVQAGYAHNKNKHLESDTSQGLPVTQLMPEHSLKLYTRYEFTEGALNGLDIGANVIINDEVSNGVGSVNVRQSGYAVADIRMGYRLSSNVSLGLNLNNVFDKIYYARINTARSGNYYGEPRNLMFTVRASY